MLRRYQKKKRKNDGLLLLLGEGLETGSEPEQFRKGLAESGDKHTHPLTQKFQLLGIGSVELRYGQISSHIMLAEHGLLLEEIGPAERNLGWQHNFAQLRINRTMKGELTKGMQGCRWTLVKRQLSVIGEEVHCKAAEAGHTQGAGRATRALSIQSHRHTIQERMLCQKQLSHSPSK